MLSDLQINAIVGPTGCGKTAAAKLLAQKLEAPIVVADRIQCFIDIPVTSARASDMKDLSYNYIRERTIADGDYAPKEAITDLMRRIDELAASHRLIVLEGGSISLLTELARRAELPFQLNVHVMSMGERGQHWQRLRSRAREMLSPANKQPGLLQELSKAWQQVPQRPFVAGINGFEAVISWCQRHGVDPAEVGEQPPSERGMDELAAEIANAHMDHSLEQEAAIQELFGKPKNRHAPKIPEGLAAISSDITYSAPPQQKSKRRVTVYCGARPGASPAYTEAAVKLGRSLAEAGIELVYGGGSIGLMGTLADATLACGGTVCGVIPQPMVEYELAHSNLTTMHVTETMHERKALMAELGDAFIALPGGLGTAEEMFEVLTWRQLGIHGKPCVLLDVEGFFTPFTALLDHLVSTQFMSSADTERVIVCSDPASAIDVVSQMFSHSGSSDTKQATLDI